MIQFQFCEIQILNVFSFYFSSRGQKSATIFDELDPSVISEMDEGANIVGMSRIHYLHLVQKGSKFLKIKIYAQQSKRC